MSVDLTKVPYFKQSYEFDCWYAALRMVVKTYFPDAEPASLQEAEFEGMKSQSKRDEIWAKDQSSMTKRRQLGENLPRGLNLTEVPALAKRNGLTAVPSPSTQQFSYSELATLLQAKGPLWCVYSSPSLHAIVLKGSMSDHLLVHDPQLGETSGKNMQVKIEMFNQRLNWTSESVFYLDVFGKE